MRPEAGARASHRYGRRLPRPLPQAISNAACSCSERTPDDRAAGGLTAIISYHSVRSDMNAMAQVVEMLRGAQMSSVPGLRYIVESTSAWVASLAATGNPLFGTWRRGKRC